MLTQDQIKHIKSILESNPIVRVSFMSEEAKLDYIKELKGWVVVLLGEHEKLSGEGLEDR